MSIKRLLLVAGLATSGLLVFGCHTTGKAPPHAFSDERAAAAPLPARLRTSAEHDAARARVGEPYVLECDLRDGGALLYYGGAHTRDPSAPQVVDIRERWAAFAPTVALCEGRQGRHYWGFLVEPFAGLAEPTLVHKLARRDGIPVVSLEPEYVDEVAVLLRHFEAPEVALYFFLRVYASEAGGAADEDLARQLLAKRTDVEGLRGTLTTLDDVDQAWARAAPDRGDWRTLTQEPRGGVLAEISDASRTERGKHMVRVLLDLTSGGERVLAVVGSGHVIRQEWALRVGLGSTPARDQPSASGH